MLESSSLGPILLFDGSKVSVEPVVLWQKVTAHGVWCIDQGVVNILMVLTNPVTKASMLDVFSVSHHILNIRFDQTDYLLFLLSYEEQCWRIGPKEQEHVLGAAEARWKEATTEPIAAAIIGLEPMA